MPGIKRIAFLNAWVLLWTLRTCAQTAFAAIYEIEAPFAPWLGPLLALIGIACELAAVVKGKSLPLWSGLALVSVGSLCDSDLALLTGNALACAGLYCYIRR